MSGTRGITLVTGATGTVGRQVVAELAERGVPVRAGVHDLAKAAALEGPRVQVAELAFEKPRTLSRALEGVEQVFLLTPVTPEASFLAATFIDAARVAGVRRVVKLSGTITADVPGITLGRWHRLVDRYLVGSGLSYTFISPGLFMQNFINYFPPDATGAIQVPHGAAKASYIDARDIAKATATVLTTEGHEGRTYTLTGPRGISVGEVAEQLAKASGRSIRYVDVPEEAARQGMLSAGFPGWAVEAFSELHAVTKAGVYDFVSPDFRALTGAEPRTFESFARDFASAWRR
jgi:uncharacterized protein YbjT (DUF2867 family)